MTASLNVDVIYLMSQDYDIRCYLDRVVFCPLEQVHCHFNSVLGLNDFLPSWAQLFNASLA